LIHIEFMAEASGTGVRYRALRPDVDFRIVGIGEDPAGRYEVVREEGEPDGGDGVFLIDPFEVPEDEDERFLAGWDAARDVLGRQRGYLGARLHRSTAPTRFRFVDVARWSSPLMVHRALRLPETRLPPDPALYQVAG
jgi:hypothetical protein